MGAIVKIVGICIGLVMALVFVVAISSNANAAKYTGLADKQVETVKIAKQQCDNQADLDRAQRGDSVGDLLAKKCSDMEAKLIAYYRSNTTNS